MRQVTATEKLRAVNEGKMAKTEFVRQMRQSYPMYISQYSQFDDTVQILKNRGMLFEEYKNPSKNLSDDSIRRGLDVELTAMGLDPVTCSDGEAIAKAKAKAIANIEKDPLHYYNLLSNESSKVDKNDQPKETKRGALEKDTFNDMKKATLKEAKLMTEGTRALVGYLSGDRLTTTYNHYDGYPSNLGKGLETHYNNDDKAKEVSMKGYITYLNPETGEIDATHKDAPGKVILPDDPEQRAREIAEEIDKFGADYGYVWDDNTNQWITIKNTGIRSMIDQILDKLDMVNIHSGDTMEGDVEETIEIPTLKETLGGIVAFLQSKGAGNESIKDFIKMHKDDIQGMDMDSVEDEYNNFISVNTDYVDEAEPLDTTDAYDNDEETQDMIDKMRKDGKDADDFVDEGDFKPKKLKKLTVGGKTYEKGDFDPNDDGRILSIEKFPNGYFITGGIYSDYGDGDDPKEGYGYAIDLKGNEMDEEDLEGMYESTVSEKKGKDHDKDGDIDGDDYMHAKDKAIKKAMGKKSNVNEAVKNIITKVLEEQNINEAATNDLAKIAAEYGDFEGLKPAVIALENVVTEIESFYDKTRSKIQKIYNDLGEIRNEEGLKVGAFIAPSIENAFKRDLRPIIKNQFHGGLDMPKVKRISQDDIDRGYTQMESPKETVFTPVNEKK